MKSGACDHSTIENMAGKSKAKHKPAQSSEISDTALADLSACQQLLSSMLESVTST